MHITHNASSAYYAPGALLAVARAWNYRAMAKRKKKQTANQPNRIRERRKAKKMSQEILAGLIEVDQTTITRYESGEINIPASQLRSIAVALACTIGDLVDTPPSIADEIKEVAEKLPAPVQEQALRVIKAMASA